MPNLLAMSFEGELAPSFDLRCLQPGHRPPDGWGIGYYPGGDPNDSLNVLGYSSAQTLEAVLRKAGDNLTRENIMKVAANLQLNLPMLYPGIDLKTAPDDFYPIERMQPQQFDGTKYVPLGPVLGR